MSKTKTYILNDESAEIIIEALSTEAHVHVNTVSGVKDEYYHKCVKLKGFFEEVLNSGVEEGDIYEQIQKWYTRKGISTAEFFNNNSTEVGRDEMLTDFAYRMIKRENETKVN